MALFLDTITVPFTKPLLFCCPQECQVDMKTANTQYKSAVFHHRKCNSDGFQIQVACNIGTG